MTVKFNVNRPVTDTEDQFRAVLQLMDAIDGETAGVAEHHPAKDATCDQCHVKDSISVDHGGLMINEASPAKSCEKAGCHSLTVAGEMPFYVKPFASLDETKNAKLAKQRLAAARDLLQYTASLKNSAVVRLGGLPKIRDFAIDIRAQDKRINNLTHDVPLVFFEPKNAFEVKKNGDLLPQYAAGLSNEVLSLVAQDMSVATRLDGTVEARMAKASDVYKYLSLADRDLSIQHLLTNSQLVLRYLATLPVDTADFVSSRLAEDFPAAVLKTDATAGEAATGLRRTITWEIPAAANDGVKAATIIFQRNEEGSRTQPSTQLQFQRLAGSMRGTAVRMLELFQERYSAFAADHARFTLTYQASQEADKSLLTTAIGNSREAAAAGELRRTLAHNENTATGTLPAPGQVGAALGAAKEIAAANPAVIRRLRSTLRFKPDLTTVSQISGEVLLGSLPRVWVSAGRTEVAEGSGERLVFTVSRETPTDKSLTVHLTLGGSAQPGKDYLKPKLRVTLPKGVASVDVSVKLRNDRLVEGAETMTLAIAGRKEYTRLPASDATVTIADDD
ncbi:calx-beta domain-containing protein [Methylococcus geothermalis]|uniref:Calx-beta domain-containing protein n=1 Tax=Methylococcus geothermalis TaxID=2681310 RepID=A0A858Q7C9_9GAMM|nr:calx-beta domain-containing protein [Methylococcus geothermalis]